MFSRVSPLVRTATRSLARPAAFRGLTTVQEALTAADAAALSGYSNIEYSIDENSLVFDAVQKFAAYNIGCLVTTDTAGRL
jgi:signal recognition particle GTPase